MGSFIYLVYIFMTVTYKRSVSGGRWKLEDMC